MIDFVKCVPLNSNITIYILSSILRNITHIREFATRALIVKRHAEKFRTFISRIYLFYIFSSAYRKICG